MDGASEPEDNNLVIVRAWLAINANSTPDDTVRYYGVRDVIKAIVSLPCSRKNEVLADLAVPTVDAKRVRGLLRDQVEMSTPLSDGDPMVHAQEQDHLVLKKFAAGQKLREVYDGCRRKSNYDDQVRTWFSQRLQWIDKELHGLLNSIRPLRIWRLIHQGPVMQVARDKETEDVVLAEVQLEDPRTAFARAHPSHGSEVAIQVDVIVQQNQVEAVCSKFTPVNFSPFSESDPIVRSQPGDNIREKKVRAFIDACSRYRTVLRNRQSQAQKRRCPEKEDIIIFWLMMWIKKFQGDAKEVHGCETRIVWFCNHHTHPMTDIRLKGLDDDILAAVPLQAPNHRKVPDGKIVHRDGDTLVELAVLERGVSRVLSEYRPANEFALIRDEDPVLLVQRDANINVKLIAAYKNLSERYSHYIDNECPLLEPLAKVWAIERLATVQDRLSVLQPSLLETIRIRCRGFQIHPWEYILERGLGDVVREAIPLEDDVNPQEFIQVELAVEPRGVSLVGQLCELVEGAGSKKQLVDKPDRYNGFRQYLRQPDEALSQWYATRVEAPGIPDGSLRSSTLRPHEPCLGSVDPCDNAGIAPSQPQVGDHESVFPGASGVGAAHSEGLPIRDPNASNKENEELLLEIGNMEEMTSYYDVAFRLLNLENRRIIACDLINRIANRTGTPIVYTGPNRCKPEWWPHDVPFCRPNVLDKEGLLSLLVYLVTGPVIGPKDLEHVVVEKKLIFSANQLVILNAVRDAWRKGEPFNAGVIGGPSVKVVNLELLPLTGKEPIPLLDESADELEPLECFSLPFPGGLKLGDAQKVLEYCKCAGYSILREGCYTILRALVKALYPNKQRLYPYGQEDRKPPGWPSEVPHSDPKSLGSEYRTRLLIHFLCDPGKYRHLRQIVMAGIVPKNAADVLNEIYNVRRMEQQHKQSKIGGEKWVKVAFGNKPTESPCGSPVHQTQPSLTPNALTMEEPSIYLGDNSYRPPSCPGQGRSEGQPWPENIYYSSMIADLDHYDHAETEFSQCIPGPTATAVNSSSRGFAALPEGLSVQPRSLCPMGFGFVPSHFGSQPTTHFPTDESGYHCKRRDNLGSDSPARQRRDGMAIAGPTTQPSPRRPTPRVKLSPTSTASSNTTTTGPGPWASQEDNRLIRLIGLLGPRWVNIEEMNMVLQVQAGENKIKGRSPGQLRDRARLLKERFDREKKPLPPNFDKVPIGKKARLRKKKEGTVRRRSAA